MNIVIVDDDQLVSLSLKTIIEASGTISVLAIGKNGHDAIELYEKYAPDVLLMDIRMDSMTGLEAAATILSKDSNARILLLTTFSDDEYIIRAIQLGAKGYILKQNFESIVPALNAVFNGQTVFGNEIVERIPQILGNKDTLSTNEERNESSFVSNLSYRDFNLNEKEIRIIQLVSDGLNNKEIADELFLSEGTVRNYISLILEKLELRDRTQLACFYYKNLLK